MLVSRSLHPGAAASNLLYNATGAVDCYPSLPSRNDELDGIWDYQWCTQEMCQETYFTRRAPAEGGIFPAYAFDQDWVDAHCAAKYPSAAPPRAEWIRRSYGGWSGLVDGPYSNIVFSNGEYDPWRAAGVNGLNVTERDVVSLLVQQGAHHLDLMFATEDDPQSVTDVRRVEMEYVAKWEAEVMGRRERGSKGSRGGSS